MSELATNVPRFEERRATLEEAEGLIAPPGQEYWLRVRIYRREDGTMLRAKRLVLKDSIQQP